MTKYARIENNTIVEILETDFELKNMFHPSIVAQFKEFNEDGKVGQVLKDGKWVNPEPDPEVMAQIEKMMEELKAQQQSAPPAP